MSKLHPTRICLVTVQAHTLLAFPDGVDVDSGTRVKEVIQPCADVSSALFWAKAWLQDNCKKLFTPEVEAMNFLEFGEYMRLKEPFNMTFQMIDIFYAP